MTRRARLVVACLPALWILPGTVLVAARRRWFGPNGERKR